MGTHRQYRVGLPASSSGGPPTVPAWVRDNPAYVVSKHAVEGITHYFGTRLAGRGLGVKSHCICPGMFPSEQQSQPIDPEIVGVSWTRGRRPARSRLVRTIEGRRGVPVVPRSPRSWLASLRVVVDGGWTAW